MHLEATPLAITTAVAIVGAVIWAWAKPSKAQDGGRLAFFVGLLWLVYLLAHVKW